MCYSLKRRRCSGIVVAACLLLIAAAMPTSGSAGAVRVVVGQMIEEPLDGSLERLYTVAARPGQVLLVTVEQLGIDVLVAATTADGDVAITVNRPSFHVGIEFLLLELARAAEWRLQVKAVERDVPPGRFRLQVQDLATAEPQELAAVRAMTRGGQSFHHGLDQESLRQALSAYREALPYWQLVGRRHMEGETLQAIALLERHLNQPSQSLQTYRQALAVWRQLADPMREAGILNGIGRVLLMMGQLDDARRSFAAARALWSVRGAHFEEALALNNLGLVAASSGAFHQARGDFEQALELFRQVGHRRMEGLGLNNLGGVYDVLGEPDAAIDHYRRALDLRRELGDRPGEAETLNNLAVVHRRLGELQEALLLYGSALEIFTELDDRRQQGAVLSNLGWAYFNLGESRRAQAFLQRALALRRQVEDTRGEIFTLNNLAQVERRLGNFALALATHQEALELAQGAGHRQLEAVTRNHLAKVQLELGDSAGALAELERALAFFATVDDRRNESLALSRKGRALTLADRPRQALLVLRQALTRWREMREPAGELETLYDLGVAELRLGDLEAARRHLETAVEQVESLRTDVVSPDLRAAFLATQHRAFALYIEVLMRLDKVEPHAGHARLALEINERARARKLLDLIGENAADLWQGVAAALRVERLALQRRLDAKVDRLLRLPAGEMATAMEIEVQALLSEIDRLEAENRHRHPAYATLTRPRPVGVAQIQELLDPETILLEYVLGAERSFLWALTRDSLRTFDLPAGAEIETAARRFYSDLSVLQPYADSDEQKLAADLSHQLLEPVSDLLRYKRLVVVPDAVLHYLPFAALPVPASGSSWNGVGERVPLLARAEVVHLSSASVLAAQRRLRRDRPIAEKWAAVIADPVFSKGDPRRQQARSNVSRQATFERPVSDQDRRQWSAGERSGETLFERLPHSRSEAEAIAALAAPENVLMLTDFDASRERVIGGELRPYRVVHFATHGLFDSRNPELSGLVLSQVDATGEQRQGFLRLSDILNLDLGAELVVLSGCQTALGQEIRGEGLVGLTHGFMYAGVPRVVASLWRVQDRVTAELMAELYRGLSEDGLSAAAALRQAQLATWRRRRFRDPYFWAAFILQGDWR